MDRQQIRRMAAPVGSSPAITLTAGRLVDPCPNAPGYGMREPFLPSSSVKADDSVNTKLSVRQRGCIIACSMITAPLEPVPAQAGAGHDTEVEPQSRATSAGMTSRGL